MGQELRTCNQWDLESGILFLSKAVPVQHIYAAYATVTTLR